MAFYRERDLKAFTKEVANEGLGIGGGFVAGGFIGRQVENMLMKTPVMPESSMVNKTIAWAANNGAKFALYVLAKQYGSKSPLARDAIGALAGSVVYDTIVRLANGGYNPANVNLGSIRVMNRVNSSNNANVQKLIQENSVLRTELNRALQKLASQPIQQPIQQTYVPQQPVISLPNPDMSGDFRYAGNPMDQAERQRKYSAMPVSPAVAERQRKYGAMPHIRDNPIVAERNRKFGFVALNDEPLKQFGMQ